MHASFVRHVLGFSLLVSMSACLPNQQLIAPPDLASAVAPNQARVYVVRTGVTATGIAAEIRDGDVVVGSVAPDNYLVWDRAPGVASLSMATDSEQAPELFTSVTLSPGETRYVELHQFELVKNRPITLAVVAPDLGQRLVKQARFAR